MLPLLLLGVVLAAAVGQETSTYSSRWDNVDVEAALKNERLLRTYFRCVMDQGRCSPDAAELKKSIPEALANQCAKCSERQKKHVDKVMRHLYEKRQDLFLQLERKYDPDGTYRNTYEKEANRAEVAAKS